MPTLLKGILFNHAYRSKFSKKGKRFFGGDKKPFPKVVATVSSCFDNSFMTILEYEFKPMKKFPSLLILVILFV
jgi:hypothetical protein